MTRIVFVALLLSPGVLFSQTAAATIPTPESVFGFAPGDDDKLATYDQIREQGCELVTVLQESITVEGVEERVVATPVTAQGYVIHSDRLVRLGTGDTRSRYLWRLIDATDTQGRRRTILTSLLAESAERITQLRYL